MGLNITVLPVVTKDLPISPRFTPYDFFIAMQVHHSYKTRQPMVEILLTHVPTLSVTEEITQILVTRIELTTSALLAGVQITY